MQCIQHSYTQGLDALCQPTAATQGIGTHKGALQRCKYPIWALNRLKIKRNHKYNTTHAHDSISNNSNKTTATSILWYPTERVYLKVSKTLVAKWGSKSTSRKVMPLEASWLPLRTRITLHKGKGSGVIYRHWCDRLGCDEENIGESTRTFGERLKGYLMAHSHIYDYANSVGHHTRVDSFSIVGRKSDNITRTIKEAMYIRVYDPSLIRNVGKIQLFHTLDGYCLIPSELQFK